MSTKAEQNRINGKRGGRPKGKKSLKTLEKEAVLKAFRERAMKHADILFDAQLTLARGQTFLYKIEKELVIGPKGGKKYINSRPKLVTEQWEIEAYLAREVEEGDADDENDPNATYYFLTAKEPNNNAIEGLLDRTFGKATQSIELTPKDPIPDAQAKKKAELAINIFLDGKKQNTKNP